ncbi:hypothetical protein FA10DRAFT_280315 [Acaromyces ingoldii]|uniref:Uncharacterized protein n=1 Tax=Acaromyces ingoldii TaxID=215250 RepID=A0A316YJ53_9BASI|nr:hypothetical protein FA10DRAFT_280315 [Acaromyces ingoldii]PWN89239.1 hypothetical protein FA10DRAFT_280315 [Acaromyces ingoldii]
MTTQGSPTSRPISGSYGHGSLKPLGCSGRPSCSFDNDGIPHFHDLYDGSPGARKRSNTVLSQCSDDASVNMKDEFALPKSTAEKLIREAEEESEKVTLGLLHRLEQLNKEKSQLSRRIEEESDQVVDRLIKSQRAAFGSSFGGSKWLGPEQLPVSPTTPASHTHPRPVSRSTVSLCALDENVVVRDMIDHQHQHQQPCASKVPPATATTPLSSRRLPISLESLRLSDLMIDADPNVVVDRLKDALAEAEAVRDQAARADKWAQETWTMANKFRNEVIELRTKASMLLSFFPLLS